jgi:hypothetical protein
MKKSPRALRSCSPFRKGEKKQKHGMRFDGIVAGLMRTLTAKKRRNGKE